MSGFYVLARSWMKHEVFTTEKFCRRAAWAWLIEEAVFKPTKKIIGGSAVMLARGQLSHSIRFMSEAWKWPKSTTERFIGRLKNEGMIGTEKKQGQLLITICNYDKYQLSTQAETQVGGTLPKTPAGQQRDSSGTKKKESNELKESKDSVGFSRTPEQEFDEFWTAYPEKVAKPRAKIALAKARKAASFDAIMAGLRRYIDGKPIDRPWAHPTTWLNQERWTDGETDVPGLLAAMKTSDSDEVVRWRAKLALSIESSGYWDTKGWGPRPGEPGCQVPAQLLSEYPAAGKTLQ